MTVDFDRLKEIFLAAVEENPPEEREAYLDRACGHDPQLRAQVSLLLAAHAGAAPAHGPETPGRPPPPPTLAPTAPDEARSESAGEVDDADLETAPASASDDVTVDAPATARPASLPPIVEGPGSQIGPYRLLQQIGEGGMGAVFMAEQERPVRRRVALKVIKPGMDSAQVLARFEAERQALALMEHPNIARVLDAGATDSGRPFFVMELVNGIPIIEYCDQARLSPRERLELFVAVCRAIQHAHQKGIIHRDIKPSNVLVTLIDGKPVPKVIDFGIAKATDQRLTERTLFTQFGSIVGTLEYMSPEQASLSGLDVDTRSDIYSLGVMLYELLTGSTPLERHRLREAGYAEVLRRIKEEEPPRPSTRLSGSGDGLASIAALRNTEPARLTRLVRGELDWIVMRALEKDRNRRYEAATGLARDVERYLADEPVEACPPSAGYRLRKFARQHRAALGTAATIAAVLVAATAVSAWQAIRATRAERHAVEAAEVLQETNTFFIDDLLANSRLESQLDAGIHPDPNIKVRTLVDRAAGQIERRFAARPLIEAAVRHMIGTVYSSLGLPAQARPHLERAEELRRGLLGEAHRDTITSMSGLGTVEIDLSLYDRAEGRLRHAWELARARYGETSSLANRVAMNLGRCLLDTGRYAEAESLERHALKSNPGRTAQERNRRIMDRISLAVTLESRGADLDAEAIFQEALADARTTYGDDHPMVPLLLHNLASMQLNRNRFAEAERLAREALEIARRLLGDRHPLTLASMGRLGVSLAAQGRLDQAEAILRPRLGAAREIYGEDHSGTIEAAVDLARLCSQKPSLQSEAEALLLRSRESARRIGSKLNFGIDLVLGGLYENMGRFHDAEREFRGAEDEYDKNPVLAPGRRIFFKTVLSKLYLSMGQPFRALDKSREALTLCEERYGADHHQTYDVLAATAVAARVAGRLDEAEALYTRLIALGHRVHGPESHDVFIHQMNFGALLHVRGRFELAERHYRESLEGLRRTGGPDEPGAITVLSNLGELYRDWGRYEPAEALLKQAIQAEQRVYGPDHPKTLWTVWKIAEMDRDRGRFVEAGASFRRCIEGNLKAQGPEGLEVATLRADLGLNELRRGEPARAEPLFREALRVYDKAMPENWRRFEIRGQLGESLAAQKKFADAEPLILGGYEGLTARRKDVTVDAWSRLPEAGRRVVRLYEAWGKPAEADRWRKKIPPEKRSTN